MGRRLIVAAVGLLVIPRAGGEELRDLLAELRQLAESQKERIDAYEAIAARRAEAEGPDGPLPPRKLQGAMTYSGSYTPADDPEIMTHVWLLLCGVLAMFMQAGFAMIETGVYRTKHTQAILIKNLAAALASVLGWWTTGYSLAYSGPYVGSFKANKVLGYETFAGHHFMISGQDGQVTPSSRMLAWFVSWAFCSAATAIAIAGVGERIHFAGSLIFSYIFSGFIYPLVVAATWGKGFLSDMNRTGYFDFAGSGIVFMSGGVAALVGALVAGRRPGRYDDASAKDRMAEWSRHFQPHSMPLVVLGTFIVWFGFYGIVCGATFSMRDNEKGMQAAQVAMNATIAAAGGGLTAFILRTAMCRKYDLAMLCNGILAGLVSIAAGCSVVEYGPAVCIGCTGGGLYFLTSLALRLIRVDDPVDAFAVYGVPGMWGVLAATFFDWASFNQVHGFMGFRCMTINGRCSGSGDGLGMDVLAANGSLIGVVFGWVGVVSAIVFLILKVTKLLKQQSQTPELRGLVDEEGVIDYKYEDVALITSI